MSEKIDQNLSDDELGSADTKVNATTEDSGEAEFAELYSTKIEKYLKTKRGSYLPWSMAWAFFKHLRPDATYQYEMDREFRSGEVEVVVTVSSRGESMQCVLPVLDLKNNPLKNPNRHAVNTARQRCLTKAIAMHGLGLSCWNWVAIDEINKPGESLEETSKKEESAKMAAEFEMVERSLKKQTEERQIDNKKLGAQLWDALDQIESAILKPDTPFKKQEIDLALSLIEKHQETFEQAPQEVIDLLKPKASICCNTTLSGEMKEISDSFYEKTGLLKG